MDTKPQEKIGSLIRELRRKKNITQKDFAKMTHTTQSVIARIEQGNQNLTISEIEKYGLALDHNFFQTQAKESDDFIVHGGRTLSGSITTNTSKNGAMGLLCASLLNKGKTTLHGIPKIEEVFRFIEIFESIGVDIEWKGTSTLVIQPPKRFNLAGINTVSAKKTRSIIMTIGSLVHSMRDFHLPYAGGCKMGDRTISAHRFGLEPFGVTIQSLAGSYHITRATLRPADIVMYEASDTATENCIFAAAGITGTSTIHFAQQNYMVREVCYFLEKLGVSFKGIGSSTLEITGVKNIDKDVEYTNGEDPIESMMFIAAGIVTKSKITIKRCPIDFLRLELLKLEKMGLVYKKSAPYLSHNKRTELVDITMFPSELVALHDKLHAQPYPGINTDNLPFFVPIATQAKGATLIHDWMWENRAIYFTELNRLGADISLADPHRVFISGPTPLSATEIVCPPALRPSTMILVAMLGAEGTSTLRNVYSIKRGYENIVERLNALGAKIETQ
jgi:UDP-N-acetylglucosamine 1-carboxyvinyltransferase